VVLFHAVENSILAELCTSSFSSLDLRHYMLIYDLDFGWAALNAVYIIALAACFCCWLAAAATGC